MLRGYLYFSEDGPGLKVTRDVASSPQSVLYKQSGSTEFTVQAAFTLVSNPPQPAQADGRQGHRSMYKESWVIPTTTTTYYYYYFFACDELLSLFEFNTDFTLAMYCFFTSNVLLSLFDVIPTGFPLITHVLW
jgi:hypothetical protein